MEPVNSPQQPAQPIQNQPTQPVVPPPMPPPTMKKQLPIAFIMIFLLVILVIGVGIYFLIQSLNAKKAVNRISVVPTAFVTAVPTFALPSQSLLYAKGTEIWTMNMLTKAKKRITTNNTPILDITVSPTGEMAAFTYLSQTNRTNPYASPASGLKIFNLKNGNVQELLPGGLSIRYPIWSPDGKYLSIWVDEGSSSLLFDTTTGKTVFEIYSVNGNLFPTSPIIFIPRSDLIAYVSNNTLYERNIDGDQTIIADNVKAAREVHEGPALPDAPHYSPDGKTVVYHTFTGELVLLNKKTTQKTVLAEGEKNDTAEGKYQSKGNVLGFNSQNELIFSKYENTDYQFDTASLKLPIYIYSETAATTSAFIKDKEAKNIDFGSFIFSPDNKKIVTHSVMAGQGFKVYSETGELLRDCFTTDFRYNFYNWGGGPDYQQSAKVWSPDGNYLVSQEEKLALTDIRTCQVFDTFGEAGVKNALWLP